MTHSPAGSALSTPCLVEGAVDAAAVGAEATGAEGAEGAAVAALVGSGVAVGFSVGDGLGVAVGLGVEVGLGVDVGLGMVAVGIAVGGFAVAAAGAGVAALAADLVVPSPLPQLAAVTATSSEDARMRIAGRASPCLMTQYSNRFVMWANIAVGNSTRP